MVGATGADGALRYAAVVASYGPILERSKAVHAKIECLPKAEGDALILAFCEANADAPLKAIQGLGGFYVKLGQMVSVVDVQLPRPWAESLRTLQHRVPPQPLARIVEIIEAEFGCTLKALGLRDLSPLPIGAASIGQCHTATLAGRHGDVPVAVKVMYPDIEHLTRLDFSMLLNLLGDVDHVLIEPLEAQLALFKAELDYRHEALNMRRVCDRIAPFFASGDAPVRVPEPYDASHAHLPHLPAGTRV